MNRIMNVVRLQLSRKSTFIGIPLLILGGAGILSIIVFNMIPASAPVKYAGGASLSPIWYFMGIGLYARNLTFPFAISLGVTRREYFLGSMLTAFFSSLGMAIVYGVGAVIEDATGGWGMNGYYFRVPGLWEYMGPIYTALMYLVLSMLLFAIGFGFASIFKRWGSLALTASLVALGLVLAGFVLLATKLNLWGAVGEFFSNLAAGGTFALVAALTVVVVAASYLPLRRSTP